MKRKWIFTAVFCLLFFFPIALLYYVFSPPVFPSGLISLLTFSVILAVSGTFLALVIGIPVSFCAAGYSLFAKLLSVTVLVPFFLPISIGSVLVYQIFQKIFVLFSLEGRGTLSGLILSHGFYEAPIIIFYLASALKGIPSVYLIQMREDGLSVFRQCLFCLRMIRMQILQASVIVFLYIFQSTALVMNVGLGRYETLESAILLSLGVRADFASAIGLNLFQTLFLLMLFIFLPPKSSVHFSLTQNRQKINLPVSLFHYLCAVLFLAFFLCWISPLFIQAEGGIGQLMQVRDLFPLWSSIFNSLSISFLTGIMAVAVVSLWIFNGGGKILIYSMIISQSLYFSGVMLCGLWWNIPPLFLAVWALSLSLMPMVYVFLKSGEGGEDRDIIRSARLDGAEGWTLWNTIYRPLWKERYVNALGKAILLSFGNFSFAYIMAQNKIPMAMMTLTDLLNRRYVAAANTYSAINFMVIVLLLMLFPGKKDYY